MEEEEVWKDWARGIRGEGEIVRGCVSKEMGRVNKLQVNGQ